MVEQSDDLYKIHKTPTLHELLMIMLSHEDDYFFNVS